jgi:hypothetical protein
MLPGLPLHEGERSEPEWSGRPGRCLENDHYSAPGFVQPLLGCCMGLAFLLFLRVQENETDSPLQRRVGGVREFVQPSDGLWSVRSPA